jgi:hypothetical protein
MEEDKIFLCASLLGVLELIRDCYLGIFIITWIYFNQYLVHEPAHIDIQDNGRSCNKTDIA